MALVSKLVSEIAAVEKVSEPNVGWCVRNLREAGLVSQGARGRHAPHATVADAANILIGVNGAGDAAARHVPDVVAAFRRLRGHAPVIHHDALKFLGDHDLTFGKVLEATIERLMTGELSSCLRKLATAYIPNNKVAEIVERHATDSEGAAAEIFALTDEILGAGVISFEVSFIRPGPSARITVSASDVVPKTFANVRFFPAFEDRGSSEFQPHGDRRDETTIGYPTLQAIAKVLSEA